jgi:hypothetical protein
MNRVAANCLWACVLSGALVPLASAQSGREVYRCPGNPVLYTDTLSAKEARDKGCRTLEGAPITVVQGNRPRAGSPVPAASGGSQPNARGNSDQRGSSDQRVDPNEQRARDSDARRILESELRREEERLAQLQKEFNNGEPERHGDERNYQKYLDRVADMKAAIARKENDIAAIKRELAKLPQ